MIRKINLIDIHSAIKERLETSTSLKAYDVVPEDAKAPFFCVQFISKEDSSTKTMYREKFNFYIHCFDEADTSEKVYDLINKVEEALTEDIVLPTDFQLIEQIENGILQIITEVETNEKRGILSYSFDVCYGFKCK